MEPQAVYTVLLQASDATVAQRWAGMLAHLPVQLSLAGEQPPSATQPEVVVTDLPAAAEGVGSPQTVNAAPIGRVIIGAAPGRPVAATEVFLPADCSARELQLACRLLGELVRVLRRQQQFVAVQQQLAQEALADPLTGLPNRRAWQLAVTGQRVGGFSWTPQSPEAVGSTQPLLCAAILDLDQFKHINDAHGYLAGDEVLRSVARALQAGLRQGDFVARIGGDEFALLLPVYQPASVLPIIERVRKCVPQRLLAAGQHAVTVSAGYSVLDNSAGSLWGQPDALLETLHAALRLAKGNGGDRSQQAASTSEAVDRPDA